MGWDVTPPNFSPKKIWRGGTFLGGAVVPQPWGREGLGVSGTLTVWPDEWEGVGWDRLAGPQQAGPPEGARWWGPLSPVGDYPTGPPAPTGGISALISLH